MNIYRVVKVKQNDAFAIIAVPFIVPTLACTSTIPVLERVETKCARKLSLIWIELRYGVGDDVDDARQTLQDLHLKNCEFAFRSVACRSPSAQI